MTYDACGFHGACGRPHGHRGHHGGWRGAPVAVEPVERDWHRSEAGDALTPRELTVLAEYVTHGTYQAAADCMGLSLQTVKNYASDVLAKTGATSSAHALYVVGWASIPPDVRYHRA